MAKLLTKADWLELLPNLKYVLSDCDGVLWHGDQAIGGAREFVAKLRDLGKTVCYVTNNSTKTREACLTKCRQLSSDRAQLVDVYCTSYATAAYLKKRGVRSIYLVGNPAIREEVCRLGIATNELGPDQMEGGWEQWAQLKLEPANVDAVVVGYDPHFSLAKVCRAASYLLRPDCLFVATNLDQTLPIERKDVVIPGTGCVVRCVQWASGRQPLVVGKPESPLVELLRDHHSDLTADNTLFIGDRLNTDIELGRRHGFRTLLVESGAHSRADIGRCRDAATVGAAASGGDVNATVPTFFVPSLADVYEFMV